MWTVARGHFGLINLFICCSIAALHCFLIDGWQTSPLLAIWAFGVGLRWFFNDRQIMTDSIVFGILSAYSSRVGFKDAISIRWGKLGVSLVAGPWNLFSCSLVLMALLALLLRWRAFRKSFATKSLPHGISAWTLQYPKARIFPSQIKHARMFPKIHSFEYSYLQCGFPIIPGGVMADGTEIGCRHDLHLGSWWLEVRAEDYLSRGNSELGFYGKLKLFLTEQCVDDANWSYAYLVTTPRFLGYAFNPVSFWYIYDSEHRLTRMIVEINNIFGERRMYLLDGSNVSDGNPQLTTMEISGQDLPTGAKSRFSDIWMKDFHVSPFNSRKGSYVLKAMNPFPYPTYENPTIDNTITLISSQDYAKFVARLNSTEQALDPDQLSVLDTARFMLNWWWVGLAISPRIIKEGFTLFIRRKLRTWLRPEVLATSLGRLPTSTEFELYQIFQDYLLFLANQSQEPFYITLHTAIPNQPVQKINTTHQFGRDRRPLELEIRVLTPAFYSRFVHYAHSSEAFDRECIFTDDKNRTLWISRPELLPLLLNKQSFSETIHQPQVARSFIDELRWIILKKLRCTPYPPAFAVSTPNRAEFTSEDVRSLPFSELDQLVRSSRGRAWAGEYRRMATKLFLTQRFGFGFDQVIGLLDLIAKVLLSYLGALQLTAWRIQTEQADIGGCSADMVKNGTLDSCSSNVKDAHWEWWWVFGAMFSMSTCHIYGLMKGYN